MPAIGTSISPKDLTVALAVEAAEPMELFHWISPEESALARTAEPHHSRAEEELAGVLIYALRLADLLDIHVEGAVQKKLNASAAKYPDDMTHEWNIKDRTS